MKGPRFLSVCPMMNSLLLERFLRRFLTCLDRLWARGGLLLSMRFFRASWKLSIAASTPGVSEGSGVKSSSGRYILGL